ncbi:MAG: hypothetical protein HY681_03095 [Chloroflexi bacterium]|nr:hypothetical protein [Chloroflexota bacterium]
MKAVVFGPGRIGCGFAGQALRASGHEVTFIAPNPIMVEHLNRVQRYRVCLVQGRMRQEAMVEGFRAVLADDADRVAGEISEADLICTAVGGSCLQEIAPLIASGLLRRHSPVNVIAYENLADAGATLRDLVASHLPPGFPLSRHGFSGAVVSRAVSHRLGDPSQDQPLTFLGDTPSAFVVDGQALREVHCPDPCSERNGHDPVFLKQVSDQIWRQYEGNLPHDHIRRLASEVAAEFRDAKITTFIPALVLKEAHERIRFKRPLRLMPAIEGMIISHDYPAWIARKLYIYNAGHAACAYLGYLKGYRYIHAAIRDPEIRAVVVGAMTEGQQGVAASFGVQYGGDRRDLEDVLLRFENAALGDPISRVGREPLRKLRPDDRLVGAAHLAERAGIVPKNLALAIASALCFFDPSDSSAQSLQHELATNGPNAVLRQTCRLEPKEGLGYHVLSEYRRLTREWLKVDPLLTLGVPVKTRTATRVSAFIASAGAP